jgi:hypothetical protein
MDLRFLSRNAATAKRNSSLQRRRGYTFAGTKIWDEKELDIVRSTAALTLPNVQKLLPHRTQRAIERRREKLGLYRRTLKPWTNVEDRILKGSIDTLGYPAIAKLLPGRSVHAVQGRAWYLGVRKGCLRCPKVTGLPLYHEIRSRAFEDGLSMQALDNELRTGKYFQDNHGKRLNWKKLAQAVNFFGGQLRIDWNDL